MHRQRQLKLHNLSHATIEIEKDVRGLVVVEGYSALAAKQAEELTRNHREIDVEGFVNRLGTGLHWGHHLDDVT